jgi:signal transduction histidine kinase
MVLFVSSIVRRIGAVGVNAQRLGVSESLLPVPAAADEIGELDEQLRETSTLLTQRSIDLVRAHTAALEAAAAADELLARISHELRTPLTAVMGFGHLIDRSQLNDEDADAVEQILSAGGHMLRIIEEGRRPVHTPQAVPLDLRAVEVGPLVQEVQSLLGPLSAGRDLTVVSEGATGTVMADYHRFKQVLINLMSNAVKFNRVGGSIVVTCKPSEVGRLRVAVTDTGEGIPTDLIDRVFVPFDRLDADARGIEGTGIGLSLSKTFVEAMGGTIGLETSVGHGSTFWVDLPEGTGDDPVSTSSWQRPGR